MKNNILKLRFTVSKSKFNVEKIHAMAFVKQGHPLLSVFNKIHYVMAGSPTRNWVRVFKLYLYKLNLLYKRNGVKGVVKYLKVCSVLLQQVVSGYKISDLGPLGLRVSRSKSGLPRIIPKYHRKMILSRDKKVIRLWLTLFSIYRDLHFAGELKIKTITEPSTATSRSSEVASFVAPFIKLYWKPNDFVFKDLLATFPMLTSGPQASRADGEFNSHPKVVLRSLTLFLQDRNKDLKDALVKVLEITNNLHILKLFYDLSAKAGNSFASRPRSSFLGRLAIKEEAAGKVRVFAMVDPWTQWALRPLHRKLFHVLSRIVTDGTFDQMKPLKRIPWGKAPLYSFDLSAATDRLPIDLQKSILASAYGQDFANNWASLLVGRRYKLPSPAELKGIKSGNLPEFVTYSAGQPMGALSSWGMLAITHHYILHYCAWSALVVPVGMPFTEYGVLGDDIVIWNSKVAKTYLRVLKTLGVEVGLAKSVISKKGIGLEFAKKTLINGSDVSPIPFKEQSAAHRSVASFRSFMEKYNMSLLKGLRFLGYGYKVDPSKRSRAVDLLHLALMVPRDHIDFSNILLDSLERWAGYLDPAPKDRLIMHPTKDTLALLLGVLNSSLHSAKELKWRLLGAYCGAKVDSIGPWSTPEAKISFEIIRTGFEKYFPKIEQLIGSIKLHIEKLVPKYDKVKDILIQLPPREFSQNREWELPMPLIPCFNPSCDLFKAKQRYQDEFKRIPVYVEEGVFFTFKCLHTLDELQLDSLLSPKPSYSKTPTFEENRRNLVKWRKWAKTLDKYKYHRYLPNLNYKFKK